MQQLPLRLHPVAHAIQSTVWRRVFAAVVGLTALGFATLTLNAQDSARSQADATQTAAPEVATANQPPASP